MCLRRAFHILFLFVFIVNSAKVRHHSNGKQGMKHLIKNFGIGHHVRRNASANTGLWPSVFNLATKAVITVNATCGESGREEFCRMVENGKDRCGICDSFSTDPGKRHPIEYAIDGTNRWWQSPALYYGAKYEHITIKIDLKQAYQIAYVIIKAANSPRPGTWILERSLNDENYEPWQYFARNDKECIERFGVAATKGKPHYFTDTEVICTSFYSRLTPMENGEIHTSLIQGRPGANETSPELLEFTKARYVRLRLMGLRGTIEPLPRWFLQEDTHRDKRLFYTIRDISIGGQCVCNGHADSCRYNVASGHPECECGHHTCGSNCDKCCPMYNQRQWGPGSSRDARQCLPCNCNGHANSCHYDEEIDKAGLSMDIHGNYQGGGVCDNCTDYTTGINCEQCVPGYYRPFGIASNVEKPCLKCECDPTGSNGICVKDGEHAGQCECLLGYTGLRCDSCSSGFRGYPKCESCPCDSKGIMQMDDCEGECECKANVEGKFCDHCKSGYFALSEDNPEGCTPCFCSGVTTLCQLAFIKPKTIQTLENWMITDLKVSELVKPTWDNNGLFSVGNYEFPNVESLYWLAPNPYLNNKLEYYDSFLTFKVHWVIMRGDTSGKPTTGPNLIIVGRNGMKIAYGNDLFTTSNMTFNIKLSENGWYHVPLTIKDIVTRSKRTEYKGDLVTREQFLNILTNIKYILLRATYHTDQIEALLEEAKLHCANNNESEINSRIEMCSCPSGYTGLSCESCAFGYVRITTNTTNHWEQGFCGKCDCNGHSETCNPDTGECFCQHNTMGETCERCLPGFYGNPLKGTPDDCKKCACPLETDENNFSPSCQLDYFDESETELMKYVCTQCPNGYTGDHCEICDDGFFGRPLELGNNCKRCDCNGGPCDRITGQCLSCKGNTEGWRCDKCKSGHYGDASKFNCIACQCDPLGSKSKECDTETGQCSCKERFTGRTCDKCEVGYGNVTAFCTPCACNLIGSKSDICDPHTGLCDCQQGVEGFHCDTCQNFHYGFSETGCKACNCHREGSLFSTCDEVTGQCRCKPHYIGLKCDKCEDGYWRSPVSGCMRCICNINGSINEKCDQETGLCQCKYGVGGEHCSTCLPNYYGNIVDGCKECDPCNKQGHICHPDNGKCVCPPLTRGNYCENCSKNAWGYEPGIGCKACDCSKTGSAKLQCDKITGRCTCKIGFEGEKCDRCSHGYYGYPGCRKCSCVPSGTLQEECSKGLCKCSGKEGNCYCKPNVEGRTCQFCKNGYFGIDINNPSGCTECFCFGRSKKCKTSNYTWDQIRTDKIAQTSEKCISSSSCWKLPSKFLGDLTTSYGGYLRIASNSLINFVVFIEGNQLVLESTTSNKFDIKMDESNWKLKYNKFINKLPSNCRQNLSRDCFMVILQNVTNIQIESALTFRNNEFNEILLDKATNIPGILHSSSIEDCHCPKEYTSLSCQDPNDGYYRYFPNDNETDNFIDRIIGVAKPCQCHGLSNICNKQTGDCLNCTEHTTGPHCEFCADGYYKDRSNKCLPCLCPSEEQNFAQSCTPGRKPSQFICNCKPGYSGTKCDNCEDGYYGNPTEDGFCQLCNCNPYGSESGVCDKRAGVCKCKPGFTGLQCSQCTTPREVIQNGICTPCDECTQMLFDIIDKLSNGINESIEMFKNGIGPPWQILTNYLKRHDLLSAKFLNKKNQFEGLINKTNISLWEDKAKLIENDLLKKNKTITRYIKSIEGLKSGSKNMSADVKDLHQKIDEIISTFNNFANSHINTKDALEEAKRILNEIDDISKYFKNYDDYQQIFDNCNKLNKEINRIFTTNNLKPEIIKEEINKFKKRLTNLHELLDQIDLINKLTKKKNKQNFNRINKLNNTINEINSKNVILNREFFKLIKQINETTNILESIENIYDLLTDNEKLEQLLKQLEQREKNYADSMPELDDYFVKVKEHVKDLENKIKISKNMFNFTSDESKKINASGAYDNLVKIINETRTNANQVQEILEQALKKIYPKDEDSIPIKANLALAFSDRLKQRIINLRNRNNDFKKIRDDLEKLKYSILQNGKNNNNLVTILHNMKEEILSQSNKFNDLEKAVENANNISDQMRQIEQEVKDINITNQYELIKNYQKYLNLTTKEEIENLMDNVTLTRLELQNININFTYIDLIKRANEERFENNKLNLQEMQKQINKLKNKIQYARQAAESINIAMSISNCKRHYKLPNDILKTLSVTFKCETCTLVNLTNSHGQFVIVEVKNNEILLNWKNQKRTIQNTYQTTTLNIEKIGRLIQMTTEPYLVEMNPIIDQDLFKIDTSNWMQIGELSNDLGETPKNDACLHKILINDQTIGLWNFVETEGSCPGCQKETNTSENVNVLFNGNGYRNVTGAKSMSPSAFDVQIYFTTFDEDSLIFLAQDKENHCSYIALTLNKGYLQLSAYHVDGTNITLTSNQTYNNGKETLIDFGLYYKYNENNQTYSLEVGDEQIIDYRPLKSKNVFKIKKSEIFIGGLPATFDTACLAIDTTSFLGYLRPGNAEYSDPVKTISYNTRLQTGELQFNKAWFTGHGHLKLNLAKQKFVKPFSLNFLLRPNNLVNNFIMGVKNLMDLYIKNDKLVIKFKDLIHQMQINLNKEVNFVEISINEDDFDVNVNGKIENINYTVQPHRNDIELHIGSDKHQEFANFNGGISNIVINNSTIMFNVHTIKSFKHVEIGRERPLNSFTTHRNAFGFFRETTQMKEMQNTEGCPLIANYETDPDAVKFGDKPQSYLYIQSPFWKKDYTIEFQFRTFYPNGILFLALGNQINNQHYNFLEIREGKIHLYMKGKRLKTVQFQEKVNDGVWHSVLLKHSGVKKKRKLIMALDGIMKKPMRMPKNNVKGEMYVGGIPINLTDHKDLRDKLIPFRGCMRSLKINNSLQTLVKNKKNISYNNIGQCFPNIEKGAYFSGDAYVVYKSDFRVNKLLELSFEFRTIEQNGILLSVSNPGNSPALSVELQNGAVVMTIDMGNGAISNVTNSLDSDYTLCNNRWHNVTALYSTSELTVNVDGIRKSWVQSDINSLMDEIEAPLYIGGLSDNAPGGTLKIKENFKGCIRKLKIEDKLMDWTDMEELNNILLNSCPVVA